MKMESEIFYESIDMSEITIDETSFAWVVDDELRSRTSSVSGSSHIRSYASIIDSMIRSRTPSNSGTSSVHSFASVVDNSIRSRTPSILGASRVYSFASVVDNAIRSRTPSILGTSPVHSFASPVDTKTVATGFVSKAQGHFVKGFQLFTLSEIVAATSNFSTDNKIGVGRSGIVYRGKLFDGCEVVIKRGETSSNTEFQENVSGYGNVSKEFENVLECLSKLHCKNLVPLVGFYQNIKERILVYEYIKNGSLSDNLHKLQSSALMSWPVRIKVALDVAGGIQYLHQHQHAFPPIIHCDINSANILLDANWNAKVSDLGLSLMGTDLEYEKGFLVTGTLGYLDPEYYRLHHLTPESDVYSFGVVLLELISGLAAIHKSENGIPRNVVDFVVPFIVQDEIQKVLDPRVPPPTPFETEAVVYVAYLAAHCVRLHAPDRPTMSKVVNNLERALATSLVQPILSRS